MDNYSDVKDLSNLALRGQSRLSCPPDEPGPLALIAALPLQGAGVPPGLKWPLTETGTVLKLVVSWLESADHRELGFV